MTNLSDLLPSGGGAKEATAIASGTLSNGQTVALLSNGQVEAVSETTATASLGSEAQFSPDGVKYIQPTKMIEEFGKIGSAVDFMNEAQNNPTSILGFDINFDNKGEGNGNSKYIGQISKFNNNQVVGTIPFVQPPLVESLVGIKRNIGLQTIGENANIFDENGKRLKS